MSERLAQVDVRRPVPCALSSASSSVFALLYVLVIAPLSGVGGNWRTTNFGSAIDDPGSVSPHPAGRGHLRRAALHRGERLLAHLRPHARRQHGARLFLPPGGYIAYEVQQRMTGQGFSVQLGGQHLGVGGPDHRGDGRGRAPRSPHAAAPPALEPGTGPAPGADHDCDLGDRRRPGDRAFPAERPRLRAVRGERCQPRVARLDEPPRRSPRLGRQVLARAPRHTLPRRRRRARPLAVAVPHEDRHGDPRRRRRPSDDVGARYQHPGHLRNRLRRRRGAGRLRRRLSVPRRAASLRARTASGCSTRSWS